MLNKQLYGFAKNGEFGVIQLQSQYHPHIVQQEALEVFLPLFCEEIAWSGQILFQIFNNFIDQPHLILLGSVPGESQGEQYLEFRIVGERLRIRIVVFYYTVQNYFRRVSTSVEDSQESDGFEGSQRPPERVGCEGFQSHTFVDYREFVEVYQQIERKMLIVELAC